MNKKEVIFTLILTLISLVIALGAAEFALRLKNADGKNYHIEMWKYSKLLKERSDNPVLGHEHKPNSQSVLQNVPVRINSRGMRGEEIPPVKDNQRRVMFIGSSATLGWGIEEKDTLSSRIGEKFAQDGQDVAVMNAGIGNYNARRYVELFLTKNTDLKPTDIVVDYYLNDAEVLDAGGGNALLRHSQLAVTGWILFNRFKASNKAENLPDHYKTTYEPDNPGFQAMKASLEKLGAYARENNVRLYLLMMPEVHDLQDYRYGFAHEIMKTIAEENGYRFVDALPALQQVENTRDLWAMPGDPHPNARAHGIFADVLYPVLVQ